MHKTWTYIEQILDMDISWTKTGILQLNRSTATQFAQNQNAAAALRLYDTDEEKDKKLLLPIDPSKSILILTHLL